MDNKGTVNFRNGMGSKRDNRDCIVTLGSAEICSEGQRELWETCFFFCKDWLSFGIYAYPSVSAMRMLSLLALLALVNTASKCIRLPSWVGCELAGNFKGVKATLWAVL